VDRLSYTAHERSRLLTSKTNERDNARELHQLTEPAGWGDLFNIRIKGVDPAVVPLSGKNLWRVLHVVRAPEAGVPVHRSRCVPS